MLPGTVAGELFATARRFVLQGGRQPRRDSDDRATRSEVRQPSPEPPPPRGFVVFHGDFTMRILRAAVLVLGAAINGTPAHSDEVKPPEGFTSLFNGKDLTGWTATGKMDVWGVDNSVIYVEKGGGGWLL